MNPRALERAIAGAARRQHGVVARRQLLALGLGANAIDHRAAAGRLVRIHRAVYAVGHMPLSTRGIWMTAVLACGPEALLSHASAAALWGIGADSSARTHVLAKRSGRDHGRIALHRARALHPDDRASRDGIPVTSVPRTLLDLAEVVETSRLRRALEEADRLRLLDMGAMQILLERSHGRHGLRPLVALLAQTTPAPHTRSELERRFLDLLRTAGLPPPLVNTTVEGFEVDMLWPARRVIVELDGYAFHRHRGAFERDSRRRAKLQVAGFIVIPITWLRLEREEGEVLAELRSLLG